MGLLAERAVGPALIPFVRAHIPEGFGPNAALDLPGLGLVTTGVFGVVWGLVHGNGAGWGSVEVVASPVADVAVLTAFVAFELRAKEPMLHMRLFR